MERVKGSKITLKTAFVKEQYGEAKLAELIESMTPEDQFSFRMVLDSAWYPTELYHRLIVAIAHVIGRGDDSIYTAMGHHSAQSSLESVYKVFKAKNPLAVLKNMVPLHSLMNDGGEMRVIPEGEDRCRVEVLRPASIPEVCKVAEAFYSRSVELAGGQDVTVSHPRCSGSGDRLCEFDLAWRNPSL